MCAKRVVAVSLFLFVTGVAAAGTVVSGPITTDTTWDLTGSPYMLSGDVTVLSGITLTITPGVEVQIFTATDELIVDGSLIAEGTSDQGILFRGQSSGDLGGSVVLRPDVIFPELQVLRLRHCDFRALGREHFGHEAALFVEAGAQPTVERCEFSSNFKDVRGGEDSFVHFADNSAVYRVIDRPLGTADLCWPPGVYQPDERNVVIEVGASLTLEPGVIVNLFDANLALVVDGHLTAVGNDNLPILLRGESSVSNGGALYLKGTSTALVEKVRFENLGRQHFLNAALRVDSPAVPHVRDCDFAGNYQDVLGVECVFDNFADNEAVYIVSNGVPCRDHYLWPKGIYQLSEAVRVDAGTQLVMEAGVELRLFDPNFNFEVSGDLRMEGTAQEPIWIHGASPTSPGASVALEAGSDATIAYARFEFLGRKHFRYESALWMEDARCSVQRSIFHRNDEWGIQATDSSPRVHRHAVMPHHLDHTRHDDLRHPRRGRIVPRLARVPEGDRFVDPQAHRLLAVAVLEVQADGREGRPLGAAPEGLRIDQHAVHVEDDGFHASGCGARVHGGAL